MIYNKRILSRATTIALLVMGGLGFSNPGVAQAVDNGSAFIDEFDSLDTSRWSMADGWVIGSPFDTDWSAEQVSVADSKATITLDNIKCGTMTEPYCSGELRTNSYQGYGCYEVKFKPSNVSGVVSSFYTFAGPWDTPAWRGTPSQHNEIDIEFLGKDTSTVQFNFWTNDDDYSSHNEHVHTLGFDASQDFHNYGFKWTSTGITWYVDGNPVYSVADSAANPTPKTTDTTQKLMMNMWPVDSTASGWAGTFTYPGSPITIDYDWARFTPGEDCQMVMPTAGEVVADFTANQTSGAAPLTVQFTDLSGNNPLGWSWDFNNDGVIDSEEQNPSYTYTTQGIYTVKLEVFGGIDVNNLGTDTKIVTNYITVSGTGNPQPTVTFTSSSNAVTESVGTVTVTAQLSSASGSSVTVPFTVGGTATGGGTDYTLSSSSITIPAGQTSGSVSFTVTNDTRDEYDETVVFTMGTPVNATKGATTVHTLTITDNDATPTVKFTASSQSIAENVVTQKTITAQLSAASGLDVTVPYTVTGTATGGGVDYTMSTSPIVIPAGQTTANATFTINNDALDEANETIIVTMGTPVNAGKGTTTVHTATITDDDATPTVTFTSSKQTVAESGSAVAVTARLSAVSGRNVTLPFTTSGTATKGTDYTISASPITITAGQQTGTATLTPIKDSATESNETAILTMGTPTNASKGTTRTHTVTITNN